MLHGAHAHVAAGQDGAAGRVHHVLGQGVDDGLAFQVNTAELIAVVGGRRVERRRYLYAAVQSLALQREGCLECLLVHICVFK